MVNAGIKATNYQPLRISLVIFSILILGLVFYSNYNSGVEKVDQISKESPFCKCLLEDINVSAEALCINVSTSFKELNETNETNETNESNELNKLGFETEGIPSYVLDCFDCNVSWKFLRNFESCKIFLS